MKVIQVPIFNALNKEATFRYAFRHIYIHLQKLFINPLM